jgi:hypothetical protein
MALWVFLFPIGVWRSIRHSRKKGRDQAVREVRKMAERGEI